jgi:predicted acylesterase/phospholipase RssA
MGCIISCFKRAPIEEELEALVLDINVTEKTVFEYTEWPFTHVVFEGGGINGVAYMGSYLALYNTKILAQLTHVSASSIGAVFGLFAALKVSYSDVQKFIMNKNFTDIQDDQFGLLRDATHLLNNYGWYRGEVMSNWIKEIIKEHAGKENLTFVELYNLYGTELHLTGCNINEQCTMIYNRITTPNTPIHIAVVASMSIPIVYPPSKKTYVNENNDTVTDLIVDGGLANNYDLDRFDINGVANQHVIGFKLMDMSIEKRDNKIFHKRTEINDLKDYVTSIISFQSTIIERLRMKEIDKYWERTLTVPSLGLPISEFNLNDRTKVDANIKSYNFTIAQLYAWIKNKKFVEIDPSLME